MQKKYATKKEISTIFGVPIDTLNKDMAQMRRSHEFKGFVLRPSYRRVIILIDGYEAFLRHKEEQRLRKYA